MKLNDTALYLSLVRSALESSIIPELQSPAAKGAAGLISTVLTELARREAALPEVMQVANGEGEVLLNELRVAAGQGAPADSNMRETSFNAAADRHVALSREISALARELRTTHRTDDDSRSLLRPVAEWEAKTHGVVATTPATEPLRETAAAQLRRAGP